MLIIYHLFEQGEYVFPEMRKQMSMKNGKMHFQTFLFINLCYCPDSEGFTKKKKIFFHKEFEHT